MSGLWIGWNYDELYAALGAWCTAV